MRLKAGFSPWHTKQNSFEQDQQPIVYQYSSKNNLPSKDKAQKKLQSKLSSRKKQNIENQTNSILRSFSKTETLVTPLKEEENTGLGFRRRVTRSSQKIDCELREEKSGKKFDDQRWRILTISSNDRFKSECAQLRKYQNLATQLKSRRSSLRTSNQATTQPTQRQKPILQQVSIKNFIIHGHYTDRQSLYQLSKRRDASYVMKQKFATLKKTIDTKENNEPCSGKKVVVVKGNAREKEHENLFKVIKLQREINAKNNKIL